MVAVLPFVRGELLVLGSNIHKDGRKVRMPILRVSPLDCYSRGTKIRSKSGGGCSSQKFKLVISNDISHIIHVWYMSLRLQ